MEAIGLYTAFILTLIVVDNHRRLCRMRSWQLAQQRRELAQQQLELELVQQQLVLELVQQQLELVQQQLEQRELVQQQLEQLRLGQRNLRRRISRGSA
jgi:hypothetical protein